MNDPYYEFLLFFLFFCVGLYINRRRFGSLQHEVFGHFLPEWAISIIFSILIGAFVWIMVHILMWSFS